MLKKILGTIAILFILVMPVSAAFDSGYYGLDKTAEDANYIQGPANHTTAGQAVYTIVGKIISVILGVLAFIFFGLITYAGLKWMTSRGNEEIATAAKDTLESAIIGLIIVLASYAITSYVFRLLNSAGNDVSTATDIGSDPARSNQCCIAAPGICHVANGQLCKNGEASDRPCKEVAACKDGGCYFLTKDKCIENLCAWQENKERCYEPRDVCLLSIDGALVCVPMNDAANCAASRGSFYPSQLMFDHVQRDTQGIAQACLGDKIE